MTVRQRNPANLVVTGSSGLLGSAAVRTFDDDFQVIGFDRDGEPQPPRKVECVCVDLTKEDSIDLGLERVRYAYGEHLAAVLHFAAFVDFSGEESPLYDEVTVQGTRRLLDALNAKGFTVDRFVFSSTMLVHAPTQPGRPINEDSPLEGKWAYPKSKIETEKLIGAHRGDIPVTIARIAGVYSDAGDSIPLREQVERIADRTLTSKLFPGDVTHGQAFLHLDDLLDALSRIIDRRRDLPGEHAVLLGESVTYSYDQLQRAFARCLHGDDDWTTQQIPRDAAKAGAWLQGVLPGEQFIKPWMVDLADDHYELDITRAREALGWEPKHRLLDDAPKLCAAVKKKLEQERTAAGA